MRGWVELALIAGLLGSSLAAPGAADAQTQGPVYVVESGDTLWGIALKFGLDVTELAAVNGMTVNDALAVGRELTIPGFDGISGVLATRPIAFGETLQSISLRYGLAPATLARLNRVANPERLFVGQDIIYPEGQGDGMLLPEGAPILAARGETEIERSMRTGLSAWAIRAINDRGTRMWTVPGEPITVPTIGRPTTGLIGAFETVQIDPLPARQGRTTEVEVSFSLPETVEGTLGPWVLNFEPTGEGRWVALQGIHAMADPGMIDLGLRVRPEPDGMDFAFSQPVYLASGDYGFDPVLNVPDETIDPATTQPENERVAGVVAPVTPERLWEGPFVFPAPYTESFPSRFGSRRNYNGTGYNYYHAGLDFYGGTGTAITAPASGRVVLAEALTVRGKTTILDHGWGVYSAYLHQSEILVFPGDVVEQGQTIGRVGATGRVTGPHLHWEVWVGGVPVDPQLWVARAYP